MDIKLVGIGVILLIALIIFLGTSIQNNEGIISLGKPSGCNYDGSCQGWEDRTCPDCIGETTTVGVSTKPECNDKIDNDGDGWIDMDDSGCLKRGDPDESDCGDGVCEGSESCTYCPEDCGVCPTTTTISPTTTLPPTTTLVTTTIIVTTTIPRSCNDTDGGEVYTVKGTVSGYYLGEPYENTDYCVDSETLHEYYCLGNRHYSYSIPCINVTATPMICSDGACV